MTDAEKELRRLAQIVTDGPSVCVTASAAGVGSDPQAIAAALAFCRVAQPAAVLALLDRIDALEVELDVTKRDLEAARETAINNGEAYFKAQGRIEALGKQVGEAERKGAEEMRKAAAVEAEVDGDVGCDECRGEFYALRDRIRRIPLPGDAP